MFFGIFADDGRIVEMGEVVTQDDNGNVEYLPVSTEEVMLLETVAEGNNYLYCGSQKPKKRTNFVNLENDGFIVQLKDDPFGLCECLFKRPYIRCKELPTLDNDKSWLLDYNA